ncbi:large conductance mechanosensitive channel protein MscL [Candidatus Nomurabacteria bacterium]|nr:large conductance mechanosensitive channel protein MscL [Candidatus Nomurabacteria bacterium]
MSEFKRFAIKGNAFELAIAVVVGNAFTAVVNSLVGDIITPLLGLLTNNVDFKTLSVAVRPDVVVRYGAFLQVIFNFIVISLAIFAVFKLLAAARERLFRNDDIPPSAKPDDVRLLEEIRDLLKKEKGEVV